MNGYALLNNLLGSVVPLLLCAAIKSPISFVMSAGTNVCKVYHCKTMKYFQWCIGIEMLIPYFNGFFRTLCVECGRSRALLLINLLHQDRNSIEFLLEFFYYSCRYLTRAIDIVIYYCLRGRSHPESEVIISFGSAKESNWIILQVPELGSF